MRNWVAGKINTIDEEIQSNMPISNTTGSNPVDTFLKYSPFILLFALRQQGFKTRNHVKSQRLRIIVGSAMLEIATRLIKKVVSKKRPNGRPDSFPSAHTATCIFGAELLHSQLKESYPNVADAGYALAMITAVLRLYHNKHWFSDIIAGALLGCISFKVTDKMCDKVDRGLVSG